MWVYNVPFNIWTSRGDFIFSLKNLVRHLRFSSGLIKLKHFDENHLLFQKVSGQYVMRSTWQSRYLLMNWAYTTNHKRISINYFWFVLFAGVVGMVLATIIRLEMAYPGVGILAGDNSQYLSIVTAHGVIMVFFMAMPLLFGFFGNFLLPTQLGVHDVAFPRMNSAAFWFLPASLLALCQLVCVDRRYQRMNCFNIKELQSLLRNRFYPEILPTNLFTANRDSQLGQLRYMTNLFTNTRTTEPHQSLLFSELNPSMHSNHHSMQFTNFKLTPITNSTPNINETLINTSTLNNRDDITTSFAVNLLQIISSTLSPTLILSHLWQILHISHLSSILTFTMSESFTRTIFNNWRALFESFFITPNPNLSSVINLNTLNTTGYSIDNYQNNTSFFEDVVVSSSRFVNSEHPMFIYKIKIGNYLPGDQTSLNFPFLYTTLNKKSILGHKADWFNSTDILKSLSDDMKARQLSSLKNSEQTSQEFSHNKISSMSVLSDLNNISAGAPFSLSNPFNTYATSLFFAQSKQIRVLNNWRDLNLHREGWRCRMLSARHQKSLYRRYVNENELIWVVEKNAKDLLPGWAMITPFSSRTRYTLIGKTDIGIAIVAITLIASMISSANFLMTYRYLSTLNNRKMRDARSFFTESVLAASWMMIGANPMLILGLFMLLSDRHWKTCFFDYSGGGDTILFQHMFWFFGHPEVYIIILPCFGITNTLLSFYLRKRISARASLMYSLYTIAFLGFFVWGHHMYMVGLSHTTRMLYSTLTVMISVPAATKIMHWLVTFVNSAVHFELPLILVLLFIFYFVSGGISGMSVAHTGMDVLFHDTFYVIGHFHVMLAGSLMFAGFAAVYFYLPSIFGVRYSRLFAYLHAFYYSIGQIFTVIPMIWLGYLGMPRRVLDYPAAMGGWHSLVSSAHMITVSGILAFVIMLFDSLRKQKSYIIKTFGVGRYNTRLNFYLYQIARNRYWLSKHFTLLPVRAVWHSKNDKTDAHNFEELESTLFYYSFVKKSTPVNTWNYL